MGRHSKKIIFLIVFTVMAAATTTVLYYYYKGPVNIVNTKGVFITAGDLYNAYIKDPENAKKKFEDQVLVVSGEVQEVSNNSKNQRIVLIKTGSSSTFINCTFDKASETINPSDKIKIKGLCNGMGQGFPELGIYGDIYLTRCIPIK